MLRELPPRTGPRPRILILGSFPGERSLAERRYYAHPRNRLWPAVAAALGSDAAEPYHERMRRALGSGIAFWDVLQACRRTGSLDRAIVPGSERPSPLGTLVERHAGLRAILLNGRSVARLFERFQLPRDLWADSGLAIEVMPSTSPANAGTGDATVILAWATAIRTHLDGPASAQAER